MYTIRGEVRGWKIGEGVCVLGEVCMFILSRQAV